MSSEGERVELLRVLFAGRSAPDVLLGIGDDAAVLAAPSSKLVWTVDAAVEGVHFRRDLLSLEDIGYRATMAAASDLAAMGASPLGLLSALVLPVSVTDDDLSAIARGQREAADALGTTVVGGNLARGAELSITTTALGAALRPLTRAGARAGDTIWIAGPIGLAAAGLRALEDRARARSSKALARAIASFRRPRARIAEGLAAAAVAMAAIDVSDGLAQDLGHVARASGVRAVLDATVLLAGDHVGRDLLDVAAALGCDPLALALHGGEDYALVVALPPNVGLAGFSHVGAFAELGASWSTTKSSVALRHADGHLTAVREAGFDHFAGGPIPGL